LFPGILKVTKVVFVNSAAHLQSGVPKAVIKAIVPADGERIEQSPGLTGTEEFLEKESPSPNGSGEGEARLLHAARSRLRLELQGLAFAISRGAAPEEYARFLWSDGAAKWMGSGSPGADEYLAKEEEAFASFFPWIMVRHELMSSGVAEVVLSGGCLGGWGENRFTLARSLGLNRSALCRYCIEACRAWGEQLGLKVEPMPGPGCRGGCKLRAVKRKQTSRVAESTT